MFTKPYMDWKYERISGAEAVGGAVKDAAIEGATAVAGGATLKVAGKVAKPVIKAGASKLSGVLSKSKSDWMARFGENLSAGYSSSVNSAVKQRTVRGSCSVSGIQGIVDSKTRLTTTKDAISSVTVTSYDELQMISKKYRLLSKEEAIAKVKFSCRMVG